MLVVKRLALIFIALMILTLSLNIFAYGDTENDIEVEDGIWETEETKPTDIIDSQIVKAKVVDIEYLEDDPDNMIFTQMMMVKIRLLGGEYKGQEFQIPHNLTGSFGYDVDVKIGDRVLVVIDNLEDGNVEMSIFEYARSTYIYIVTGVFLALILVIGKMKGLKTVVTLGLTIVLILKGLIPGLLAGYSPILLTIGIAFIITLVTILTVSGINKKSYAAIIGVLGGVFVAGLIAYIIGSKVKLTGLSTEEAVMLMYIPQAVEFDFKGLLFAGIIMGALGAVMDVGMSIASSMEEIKHADPTMPTRALIMSGMNVGKDIMGTMANTLILAYTGSSIPLLLLFTAYGEDFTKIINLDIIATEIIRALAGSIGLVLCVPITAFVAGMLAEKSKGMTEDTEDIMEDKNEHLIKP